MALAALALALLLVAAAALWSSTSAGSGDGVPTFRVERGPFVLKVPAEGVLKAVSATPIGPPADAPGPMRTMSDHAGLHLELTLRGGQPA